MTAQARFLGEIEGNGPFRKEITLFPGIEIAGLADFWGCSLKFWLILSLIPLEQDEQLTSLDFAISADGTHRHGSNCGDASGQQDNGRHQENPRLSG